jgi:hypothetical protein
LCVYIQIIVVSSHYYCARARVPPALDRTHTGRGFNRARGALTHTQLPKSYLRACFMRLISFYHMHETQIPASYMPSLQLLGKCFHEHTKQFSYAFLIRIGFIVAVWISAFYSVFSLFLECRVLFVGARRWSKCNRACTRAQLIVACNEREFGSGAGIP